MRIQTASSDVQLAMDPDHSKMGENIIFLVSQPRAGSTLLQAILSGHPDVHSLQEPWLMLHPLYDLWHPGEAVYEWDKANKAVFNFLDSLPNRREDYFQAIRLMGGYLYKQALASSGRKFFLDKTPRYYWIVPELHQTFPDARFIILFRNPLAVLTSIIHAWDLLFLFQYKEDLLTAPGLLLAAAEKLNGVGVVIHYENFTVAPETELKRICESLGLPFTPEILEYSVQDSSKWIFGDKHGILQQNRRPVREHMEDWLLALKSPQIWRLAHEYLQSLGPETIQQMGYSYEELNSAITSTRPGWIRLVFTLPLAFFLRKPPGFGIWLRRSLVTVQGSIRHRGWGPTIKMSLERLRNRSKESGNFNGKPAGHDRHPLL